MQSIERRETERGRSSLMMQYARAFAGLFVRDLYVLRREIRPCDSAHQRRSYRE
jgi:hypothetical protein